MAGRGQTTLVHGEGRSLPAVVTAASNSPTAPTPDPNRRRDRLPWKITTPLGHPPRQNRPHRRRNGFFLAASITSPGSLTLRNGGVHEVLPRSTGGIGRHLGGFLSKVNATLTSPIHARAERRGQRTRKTSDSHCPGGPTCKLTRAERGAGPSVWPHRRFVASSAQKKRWCPSEWWV
jgi:hypothetical protein